MQPSDSDTEIATTALGRKFASRVSGPTLDHARRIGLSILPTIADRSSYVLGVTSALINEGKTTVSLALAEVMATDFGHQVIVLDTHAERPWSQVDHDIETHQGLNDCLNGACALEDALLHVHEKYHMLPLGTQPDSSRSLLQSITKLDVLDQLRERYSLIVVDLPNLGNASGPALANLCDGIVLVVWAGHTSEGAVREFLPVMEKVTIHGVVLNRHKSAVPAFLRRVFVDV